MSTLRIFTFGPIQFRRSKQVIQLRAAKAIARLAYLAQRRKMLAMLASLLWPHSLPQAARKNLSNTLSI